MKGKKKRKHLHNKIEYNFYSWMISIYSINFWTRPGVKPILNCNYLQIEQIKKIKESQRIRTFQIKDYIRQVLELILDFAHNCGLICTQMFKESIAFFLDWSLWKNFMEFSCGIHNLGFCTQLWFDLHVDVQRKHCLFPGLKFVKKLHGIQLWHPLWLLNKLHPNNTYLHLHYHQDLASASSHQIAIVIRNHLPFGLI